MRDSVKMLGLDLEIVVDFVLRLVKSLTSFDNKFFGLKCQVLISALVTQEKKVFVSSQF